jgi:hypothetical protein
MSIIRGMSFFLPGKALYITSQVAQRLGPVGGEAAATEITLITVK